MGHRPSTSHRWTSGSAAPVLPGRAVPLRCRPRLFHAPSGWVRSLSRGRAPARTARPARPRAVAVTAWPESRAGRQPWASSRCGQHGQGGDVAAPAAGLARAHHLRRAVRVLRGHDPGDLPGADRVGVAHVEHLVPARVQGGDGAQRGDAVVHVQIAAGLPAVAEQAYAVGVLGQPSHDVVHDAALRPGADDVGQPAGDRGQSQLVRVGGQEPLRGHLPRREAGRGREDPLLGDALTVRDGRVTRWLEVSEFGRRCACPAPPAPPGGPPLPSRCCADRRACPPSSRGSRCWRTGG